MRPHSFVRATNTASIGAVAPLVGNTMKKIITEIVDEAWTDLLEKDDRTSPEDYPEMCLITKDELADFMRRPMIEITELELKVLDAAREWLIERNPQDPSSKALFAAVCRAYPGDLSAKEDCNCGEQDDCDECLPRAQIEAMVRQCEIDSTPAAEDSSVTVSA